MESHKAAFETGEVERLVTLGNAKKVVRLQPNLSHLAT